MNKKRRCIYIVMIFLLFNCALQVSAQSKTIDLLPLAEWSVSAESPKNTFPKLLWNPPSIDSSLIQSPSAEKEYWFRLAKDSLPKEGYIRVIGQDKALFYDMAEVPKIIAELGYYLPLNKLPIRGVTEFVDLSKMHSSSPNLVFRVKSFNERPYPIRLKYYNQEAFDQWILHNNNSELPFYFLIAGGTLALIFLALFALLFYVKSRKPAYMFYALYLVTFSLYFIRLLEYQYHYPVLWGYLPKGYALAESICIPLTYLLYMLFVRHFLSISNNSLLWKIFRIWIGFSTAIILLQILGVIIPQLSNFSWDAFTLLRFSTIPVVIFALWEIHRKRILFSKYIIWGSLMLLVTGGVALFIAYIFTDFRHPIFGNTFFIMMVGVLFESFCFALGLGASARNDELEKIASQNSLIEQLKKEAILENEIQESRIQTLTAQMNPHFIFNALNSIQHFILTDEKKKSIRYLSKFAKLVRGILENTTSKSIALDKEIDMLKAYVEIEQMRFHDLFHFEIKIDEELSLEEIYIPHMIIQPFVENSILHGLTPLQSGGKLTINLQSTVGDRLLITITDNGVGRKKAAEIGANRRKDHTSVSINSIKDRLEKLLEGVDNPVVYEDVYNEKGEIAGTKVTVVAPIFHAH